MSSNSDREIEIKLKLDSSLEEIQGKLRHEGFTVLKPRVFEENVLFDTGELGLARSGQALRIRRAGSECIFTYKGPAEGGRHKSREEIEVKADSFENLERIVLKLGYRRVFRYEKYRTEFRNETSDGGIVTVDETPVGTFLEVEGEPQWIDRTATQLGFSQADFITQSYRGLYEAHCQDRGLKAGDMVFCEEPVRVIPSTG